MLTNAGIPPLNNTPTVGRRRSPEVPAVSLAYLETYTRAGIAVMPLHTVRDGGCSCGRACHSPAKHPRTENGKDDATTDPAQLREWLARWPRSNWGGRPPVGHLVLDVDPRNGGHERLADLVLEHGALPETRTARTGGNGLHYWLALDGQVRGKLDEGLDVKTNSGYLVLPPSVHMSGGSYRFIVKAPVAACPEWLADLLRPPVRSYSGGGVGIAPLIRAVDGAAQGNRNDLLYWAACRAVAQGIDPALLLPAALRVGLTEHEASRTIESAHRGARTGA